MGGYIHTIWQRQATPAVINTATSGDNELVQAAANAKIRVYSCAMLARGSVLARFESGPGGDALTGQMSLGDTTGFVLDHNEDGWFETNEGESLNLELSGATNVDGVLNYRYIYKDR